METAAASWTRILDRIQAVQTAQGRDREGAFALEGTRLVERALRSGTVIEAAIVSSTYAGEGDARATVLMEELAAAGTELAIAPDRVIEARTGGRDIGHILARARRPDPSRPIPVASEDRQVWLVAVDILDPGNMGAMIRSAHAGGARGVIAAGVSDPWHPRAVRTAMGSLFKMTVLKRETGLNAWEELHVRQVHTIAAACDASCPLPSLRCPPGPVAVFMGSEAFGLPEALLARVDQRTHIPMTAGVDSFSVNAAAAIILYELCVRQTAPA